MADRVSVFRPEPLGVLQEHHAFGTERQAASVPQHQGQPGVGFQAPQGFGQRGLAHAAGRRCPFQMAVLNRSQKIFDVTQG
ncbi:hypothetical protein D3C72_2349910 [compost metagenome]